MSRLVFVIGGSGSGRRATAANISKTIKSFTLFNPLEDETNFTARVINFLNTKHDIVCTSTEPKYAFQIKRDIEKHQLSHRVFILFMDIDQKNRIKNIQDDGITNHSEIRAKIDKEEKSLNHFFNTLQVAPDFTISLLDDATQPTIISEIFKWLKSPTGNSNSLTPVNHRQQYHQPAPHTRHNHKPK